MSLTLTKAEKDRRFLLKLAQGNPQAITVALDEVRSAANDALNSTLEDAKVKAFEHLERAIEKLEDVYKQRLGSLERSLDRFVEAKVRAVVPTKGEKGDQGAKGDKPTVQELLALIEPRIPFVRDGRDGKTPTREELAEIMKPLIAAALTNAQPTLQQQTEAQKKLDDKLAGIISNEVAKKISEVKRFSGGGSGDRVKAGSGVTITTNASGAKVISAAGSGSVETPTGDVNASNTAFTVTTIPKWIIADGTTYFEGAGYSRTDLAITMDIPPSQYIRAVI